MEIEQYYPSENLLSQRQSFDSRRITQDNSLNDNNVQNIIQCLEANYSNIRQICDNSQQAESQEQILIRTIKESIENAQNKFNIILNFKQMDIQPILMERVIFSIGQLSHLNSIHINLSSQKWGPQQVQVLCSQLMSCHQLNDLDIDLGLNCISDQGHEILTETLSHLGMLQKIKINLERNGLQNRSISMLEVFNKLTMIEYFSLNLNGNAINLDDEMKSLLPKFKSENIFSKVKSFEIMINEYISKKSNIDQSNGIQGSDQIQGMGNQSNFVENNQQSKINSSNSSQLDQNNQQQNQEGVNGVKQQMQLIQQTVIQQQQQLQQIHLYAQQMAQRGFPQNHPQYLQVLAQMQQLQLSIQQNQQIYKALAQKVTATKKKSVISRLIEIMLKFTTNLEEFSFSCPGQLIDSACWEYFAELIKIRSEKLTKFHFSGFNSTTKNQDLEYFFYQMAKLKNLTDLSLSFHNLSSKTPLNLERFLKPLSKLQRIHIDLSSPDSFSNQQEIFRDLSSFINNTESKNINEINLNISNSQIDTESALGLFQGIAKMSNLSILKLSMQQCQQITDKTLDLLCQALLYQKSVKNLHIDVAQSNFSPASIQNIMQTIVQLKEKLISLQLNFTNRGEGFINFNNNIINDAVTLLTNLKKCVISSNRNPKIRLYREKAEQVQKAIKICQQAKNSNAFKNFRKEIAFEALQFLIQ